MSKKSVVLTSEEKITEYRYRMQQYYWEFFTRSNTFKEATKNVDPESDFPIFTPVYMKPFGKQRGNYHTLSYSITIPIMDDLDTIKTILNEQVTNIISDVKNRKTNIHENIIYDYIRDSSGRKVAPSRIYKLFDNILTVYDDSVNKVPCKQTVDKIKTKGCNQQSALNHISQLRCKAKIFIERAEKGTFPYSENGKWE